MTKPKTIKVRIPVAVWPDGGAYAFADVGDTDERNLSILAGRVRTGHQIRWIEAQVPAYDEPVVTGEVVG